MTILRVIDVDTGKFLEEVELQTEVRGLADWMAATLTRDGLTLAVRLKERKLG